MGYLERNSHAAWKAGGNIRAQRSSFFFSRVEQNKKTRVKVLSASPPSIHSTQVPIYYSI